MTNTNTNTNTNATATDTSRVVDLTELRKQARDFHESAYSKVIGLESEAKITAEIILYAKDPTAAMQAVFDESRQPYALAKTSGAKIEQKNHGTAWNNQTAALRHWFDKANMVASWPNIRSGTGDCTLTTKADAKADAKAAKLAQAERDNADALAAEQQRDSAELDAIRSLTQAELVAQIEALIGMSSHAPQAIVKALAEHTGMNASVKRQRKAATPKAVIKKAA